MIANGFYVLVFSGLLPLSRGSLHSCFVKLKVQFYTFGVKFDLFCNGSHGEDVIELLASEHYDPLHIQNIASCTHG